MYDIIIIGGGISGTTIARKLSRYKLKILLLDKENDVSMGATKSNSAIVHGGYAESHSKLKGRLCYQGRIQYDKLNEELNFGFSKIGSLVLNFSKEGNQKLKELYENGLLNGLDDLEIIDRKQILNIEPNVNPEVLNALYCKGAGICSPYEMAIAMAENAVTNGVELKLNTEVLSIIKNKDTFTVNTSEKSYKAKFVVNAAGINAYDISMMLGIDKYKIKPRSGEYIIFGRDSGSLINHVLFQMPTKMGKGVLLTPTYHNNLMIGPDAIDIDNEDKSTHAKRLVDIFMKAQKTTDKINEKLFIRSFTGLRATNSINDFLIEESEVKGFIQVSGIQSPGLTSAPAIADMVIDILSNGIDLVEKENFEAYRKPIIVKKKLKPMKEITPLLNVDTDDKIICRCEQVDKATILDAASRNIEINSVDSIKRRTRAGMGFCQGSFCKSRVLKLLPGIDPNTDVEHSGINRIEKKEFWKALKDAKIG